GPHASTDAADRLRRAAADVHGIARPDHSGDRTAHDRTRLRRRTQPTVADHRVSARIDGDHPTLRQDRRHPRPPLHASHRDLDLHGRLARLRVGAEHAGFDFRPRLARAGWRRPVVHGHDRARRPGLAQGTGPLLRFLRSDLHHRWRQRTLAWRLDRGPFALVGHLLDQYSHGARGPGDHDVTAAPPATL